MPSLAMTTKSKAFLFITLILSTLSITIYTLSYENKAGTGTVSSDKRINIENVPSVQSDTVAPSVFCIKSASSDKSNCEKSVKRVSDVYELVEKLLKNDEDLEILVSEGMEQELKDYLSKNKVGNDAVQAELNRRCNDIYMVNKQSRNVARRRYKAEKEKIKRKFTEEYAKESENNNKNFKQKSVKIK